jgi:hypothetical protein
VFSVSLPPSLNVFSDFVIPFVLNNVTSNAFDERITSPFSFTVRSLVVGIVIFETLFEL